MRSRRLVVWLAGGLLLAAGPGWGRDLGGTFYIPLPALPDCSQVSEDRAGVSPSLAAIWPGAHLRFFGSPWSLRLSNRPAVALPVNEYDLSVASFSVRRALRQSVPVFAGVEAPLGLITMAGKGGGADHWAEEASSFPVDDEILLPRGLQFGRNWGLFRLNNPETWPDD